jgi:hypothetical protein
VLVEGFVTVATVDPPNWNVPDGADEVTFDTVAIGIPEPPNGFTVEVVDGFVLLLLLGWFVLVEGLVTVEAVDPQNWNVADGADKAPFDVKAAAAVFDGVEPPIGTVEVPAADPISDGDDDDEKDNSFEGAVLVSVQFVVIFAVAEFDVLLDGFPCSDEGDDDDIGAVLLSAAVVKNVGSVVIVDDDLGVLFLENNVASDVGVVVVIVDGCVSVESMAAAADVRVCVGTSLLQLSFVVVVHLTFFFFP